jgi:PAS domain S-box-containing protein
VLTRSDVILEEKLGAVVWYPALGLGFALMVGLSPAYAPLVMFTDALCAAINYHQPFRSWGSLVGTPINTLIYAFAAHLLRGPLGFDFALKRRRDISLYGLAALGAAVPCGLVGAVCLVADGSTPLADFKITALRWCLGDAVSLLGATPFLLIHVFPWIRWKLSRAAALGVAQKSLQQGSTAAGQLLETAGQAGSVFLVLWIIFRSPFSEFQPYYLVLLPVIWSALRQGISGATASILGVNLGMALCEGIYVQDLQSPARLGLLMLVVSFTGLIVGSAVSERYLADHRLREQTMYLNLLIANSPFGIVVVDSDLRIGLCNAAFAKLFLSTREELSGKELDSLALRHTEIEQLHQVATQVFSGCTVHQVIQHEYPDRRLCHLELHVVPLEQDGHVRQAYAIYKDITEQVMAENAAREHAESLKIGIEELQLRAEQMGLMNQMADFLQCCADSQEAYSVFMRFAPMLFNDASSGMLFAVRPEQKFAEAIVSWGASHLSEPVFDLESCWALRRGAPHWSHLAEPITCAHMPTNGSSWFLCLPMVAQGETIGVLHLQYEAGLFQASNFDAACSTRQRLADNVAGQLAVLPGQFEPPRTASRSIFKRPSNRPLQPSRHAGHA